MDIYHAIADPNRRKLLELLTGEEQSVQDLASYFNVTLGAISQHLKILQENQLIVRRKQGRFRFYRARPARLKEVHDWTLLYKKFWESKLEDLGDYLDENP